MVYSRIERERSDPDSALFGHCYLALRCLLEDCEHWKKNLRGCGAEGFHH